MSNMLRLVRDSIHAIGSITSADLCVLSQECFSDRLTHSINAPQNWLLKCVCYTWQVELAVGDLIAFQCTESEVRYRYKYKHLRTALCNIPQRDNIGVNSKVPSDVVIHGYICDDKYKLQYHELLLLGLLHLGQEAEQACTWLPCAACTACRHDLSKGSLHTA